MKHLTWIALTASAGLLLASVIPAAADATALTATVGLMPSAVEQEVGRPEARSGAQQVTPPHAESRGIEAADAAIGSLLSLSSLVLVAVFGSRWLIGRRR